MMTYIDKTDVINIIKHSIMNNGHAENSKEIFNIIINYSNDVFCIEDYINLLWSNIITNNTDYCINDCDEYYFYVECVEKFISEYGAIKTNNFSAVCSFCLKNLKTRKKINILKRLEKINICQSKIVATYNDMIEILSVYSDFNSEMNSLIEQRNYFDDMIEFYEIIINDYCKKEQIESLSCKCSFDNLINIEENTDLLKLGMDYEAYKRMAIRISETYKILFPFEKENMILYNTPDKIISFIKIGVSDND